MDYQEQLEIAQHRLNELESAQEQFKDCRKIWGEQKEFALESLAVKMMSGVDESVEEATKEVARLAAIVGKKETLAKERLARRSRTW
jgi:HD-GYP domain-containing protein (c-di-GMP phosphodiesterase class II)